MDPERGALVYRKTTQVETVEPDVASSFTTKKIKTVTSESSWLGQAKEGAAEAGAAEAGSEPTEVKPWQDEEVESNPLYAATEYLSDFHNPLYSRQSEEREESPPPTGTGDEIPLVSMKVEKSRVSRGYPGRGGAVLAGGDQEYTDDFSNADTLF